MALSIEGRNVLTFIPRQLTVSVCADEGLVFTRDADIAVGQYAPSPPPYPSSDSFARHLLFLKVDQIVFGNVLGVLICV